MINFNFDLTRLSAAEKEKLLGFGKLGFQISGVLFVAYVFAGICSAMMMTLFIDTAMSGANNSEGRLTVEVENISRNINFRNLQIAIKDRNLFNSEGVFPDEPDPLDANASQQTVFDEGAPCTKTSLNIELVGTIFLGDSGSSIATIQEKGYQQADVYRKGDAIYGTEGAKIYQIEQRKVVLNNNGKKECLEMEAGKGFIADSSGSPPIGASVIADREALPNPETGGEGCTSATLEEKYVAEQLGTGFDKILSKGRLVPHNKDGQMLGFKLIGMDAASLFGKVCLKNGDVITQVNEISMQQPEQGFALYQAFQDEQKIRISLLRNGTTPMTVNVQIK